MEMRTSGGRAVKKALLAVARSLILANICVSMLEMRLATISQDLVLQT